MGLHFLSFWPFGPSFPFILAFWAFISFHFGLLGLHFLSFWPFGPSFPFILAFWASFPFILAFWAFISFHFGLLGLHFLSFWPFGPSFPFIVAFWAFIFFILASWAFISFHFGLLGLHFLSSSGLCHPSATRCSLLMALRAARPGRHQGIYWATGRGSPFGNLKLFAEGPHQGTRGLGGIKVYIGPRGWIHPSVTRSSLLMAPIREDAAWAASRYILGHGAGFTLR